MGKRAGISLILASIAVAVLFLITASFRDLTGLENIFFQVLILGISLGGSFIFGRESALEAAKDLIKPHAKSAFRRLLSQYRSLGRLVEAIQSAKQANNLDSINFLVLDKLESLVIEQIATADDALEDWRDIIPEEVEGLYALAAMRTRGEQA